MKNLIIDITNLQSPEPIKESKELKFKGQAMIDGELCDVEISMSENQARYISKMIPIACEELK